MRSRLAGGAFAALLGLAGTAAILPGTAGAAQTTTSTRVAGTDRYGTAAQAAQLAFPTKVTKVILASGEAVSATDNNSPDALAASGLAGAAGAPILLTAKNSLPAVTANALGTLTTSPATTTIYIAGGTAAVSQSVRDQLKALGYTLVELSGTDRYDTGSKVATQMAALSALGTFNGQPAAIVATGEQFADALAGGVAAFGKKLPVLLTPSATLGASASASLTSLAIKQAIVLGGTSAISQANEDAMKAKGITVTRIAGTNRFDTAAKLATFEITPVASSGLGLFLPTTFGVTLANGLNFPDALSAAPLAAKGSGTASPAIAAGPLLLMASTPTPAETSAFLGANKAAIQSIGAMGGTSVISDADIASAKTSATTATPTATITAVDGRQNFTVTFSEAVSAAKAATLAFYKVNNIAIPASGAGVVTLPAGATSATTAIVTLPTNVRLAAGDVVTATKAITTLDGRAIADTSVTVAADAVKPSATITPFVGTKRVYIAFSEPVVTGSFTPSSNLQVTGSGTLGTATVTSWLTPVDSRSASAAIVTGGAGDAVFAAGDVVNSVAGQYTDASQAANTNTASSGTAVNDTTAPSATSAKVSTLATVQAARITTGTGNIKVTALAGTAAEGAAGNDWTLTLDDTNSTPTVAINSGTKTITVSSDLDNTAGLQSTASTISNLLNANSSFASLFTSTVNFAGIFNTASSALLSGGTNQTTITVTFSEAVDPSTAVAGNFGVDLDGNGTSDLPITSTSTTGYGTGVIVLNITQLGGAATLPHVGVAKVIVTIGVTDLKGNANTGQTSVTTSS